MTQKAYTEAYIGLGANLGQALKTLQIANQALAALPQTQFVITSNFYQSAPVNADGPDYVNAVSKIHTHLDAWTLLLQLQNIEKKFGRTRLYPNAPRTLDLDLLLFGQEQIQSAKLTVPHPRMQLRAFVLRPLADIAPKLILKQGPIEQLLKHCSNQPIKLLEKPIGAK